jgi:CspA family cold shock protein
VTIGKILSFDEVRGFGFIATESGGEDVFMHANDLLDEKHLYIAGATVEFEREEGDRGYKASSVRIVHHAPAATLASHPARTNSRSYEGGGGVDGNHLVPSTNQLSRDITELLIEAAPSMTGAQIAQVRQRLVSFARERKWVDPSD